MKRFILVVVAVFSVSIAVGQIKISKDTNDLTFKGTRISPYSLEYDTTGSVEFTAYIDAYYATYSDTSGAGGYQKFPTTAPRNNQFGLNILQFGAKYQSRRFRGIGTVFFGDTPSSSWSSYFNMIQEAHLGFKIFNKLWIDAGFFRTHIGLESIQPRENITMSIATTTYFEPYFMSGAKLTWEQSSKWMFQLNAFNGYNNFVDNNKNIAIGASTAFSPTDQLSFNLSTLYSDESNDGGLAQNRSYTNFVGTYHSTHWTLGLDLNYGIQTNSKLTDSTQTASMFSTIAAVKYRITPSWAIYGRGEYFSDADEILTGPVVNENHELIGLDIAGLTIGGEYKPIPNSFFRIEGRILHADESEHVFQFQKNPSNLRYEVIAGIGVWF